jgi:hypothetical protein
MKEPLREQEMRRSGRLEQSVVDLREQVAFSLSLDPPAVAFVQCDLHNAIDLGS